MYSSCLPNPQFFLTVSFIVPSAVQCYFAQLVNHLVSCTAYDESSMVLCPTLFETSE